MATNSYKQIIDQKNNAKVLNIVSEMPFYAKDFFNHIHNTASRTKLSYAYNIKNFLNWLKDNNPELKDKDIKNIDIETLNMLKLADMDEYLSHTSTENTPAGIAQKMSALNNFFSYLKNTNLIESNPMSGTNRVKVDSKPILKLTPEQVETLLNTIEFGWENMSSHQKAYWQRDKARDLAIISLFLSSGIRISECVGLNLEDLDIEESRIFIIRKGHKEKQSVYFNDETTEILKNYLNVRPKAQNTPTDKGALFLSDRGKRMSLQTVENLVRKYTTAAGFGDNFTPHTLRKTYGTELYNQTNDIYYVANTLGHADVSTTTKHYVETDIQKQKDGRNIIKLRKE